MAAKSVVEEITFGPETVRYTVRRSERARRMSLRVVPGRGLEVVLPRGVPKREAAAFVRREREWVLQALARVAVRESAQLSPDHALPYLGETLRLSVVQGERNRAGRQGDDLTITVVDGIDPSAVVEAWYRAEARRVIGERVALHAAALGLTCGRIAIKDTSSRWGSCSSKGNLNFSWRLLLAPFAVLDYVVVHEVAHLRQPNHSPRFWALVESLCPDYREHRAWLRRHGSELAAWPGNALTP